MLASKKIRPEKISREESLRLKKMSKYEHKWKSHAFIAGVDEAGMSPLAGPIIAGAVILKPGTKIIGLDDSKKLSEKKREQLYDDVISNSLSFAIGKADLDEIKKLNVYHAGLLAMRRAVLGLNPLPTLALVDARTIPDLEFKQEAIIHGDALSISIAAASIIAKVTRDRIMRKFAIEYPEYGFEKHKGYGVKSHLEAIKKYGATPLHRMNFQPVIDSLKHGR